MLYTDDMNRLALSIATLLIPFSAFAADIPAGFAPNSIWVSSTKVTEGDTINLFTAVYNSSDVSISADADFAVDGKTVGTKHFALKAGETQIQSVPWQAQSGSHAISAQIENVSSDGGTGDVSLINRTTDTITIDVAKAPPPPAIVQAAKDTAQAVQSGIAASAPIVSGTATMFENLRKNAVTSLEDTLAKDNASGKVLGTSTRSQLSSAAKGSDSSLGSIQRGFYAFLLGICRVQFFFYAALILVAYVLYKLVRTVLAERSHNPIE